MKLKTNTLVVMSIWVPLWAAVVHAAPPDFLAGADISDCDYFSSLGAAYRDQGRERDPVQILKDHGVNIVRLRLFTSTDQQAKRDPYNSINNISYTLPLAVRVSRAGLPFVLDFHYSDSWADATHQTKPRAWQGLTLLQLEQRMYQYNRDTITTFRRAGAMPLCVQIGNEITGGMVWPEGSTRKPAHWQNLGRLMQAAIRGIRDGSGDHMPKIIVHISQGDDQHDIQSFFQHLKEERVDYDIIGLSYYPDATSRLEDLQTTLNITAARFRKPVMVVETAFPFVAGRALHRETTPVLGLVPSPDGQAKYIEAVCRTVQAVPNGMGVGVLWWGAEYQPVGHLSLDGYDNSSLFDHHGNVLPAMDTLAHFGSLTLAGDDVTRSRG